MITSWSRDTQGERPLGMLNYALTCRTMASSSTEPETAETSVPKNSTSVMWDYFAFKKEDAEEPYVLWKVAEATF